MQMRFAHGRKLYLRLLYSLAMSTWLEVRWLRQFIGSARAASAPHGGPRPDRRADDGSRSHSRAESFDDSSWVTRRESGLLPTAPR